MFRVVIAYALFVSGTYSQSKLWYDKFIKYIDRPDGLSVSIDIHQKQIEEEKEQYNKYIKTKHKRHPKNER